MKIVIFGDRRFSTKSVVPKNRYVTHNNEQASLLYSDGIYGPTNEVNK